jgi:hypothetical protein
VNAYYDCASVGPVAYELSRVDDKIKVIFQQKDGPMGFRLLLTEQEAVHLGRHLLLLSTLLPGDIE